MSTRPRPPPRPPRAAYHHGDLRAALLAAVAEVIRERGVGEVSLREAARRAQVSHGAPAHHFRNKAGLLTAFAAQGFEQLGEAVRAELERRRPQSGEEVLEALGHSYVRFALGHPEHFGIMFRTELLDETDPELTRGSDAAFAVLVSTIERCVAEGRLPAARAEVAVVASWSLAHGLATLWLGGRVQSRIRPVEAEQLSAEVISLYVQAVLRRPSDRDPARPRARRPRRRRS
jgi:AcrR family transcriptional regulator